LAPFLNIAYISFFFLENLTVFGKRIELLDKWTAYSTLTRIAHILITFTKLTAAPGAFSIG
jgi:hypothetical protein